MTGEKSHQYEVALSVRGPGSEPQAAATAQLLASMLKRHGLSVFMYNEEAEEEASHGIPLKPQLQQIYLSSSRQVIIVASRSYGASGVTRQELDWIHERRKTDKQRFLTIVATTDDDRLPAELRELAYFNQHQDLKQVVRLILRRAGRRGRIRGTAAVLLLLALAHLWLRCFHPPRLTWPMVVAGLACGLTLGGILLFLVAPRVWRWPIGAAWRLQTRLRRLAYSLPLELSWWAILVVGIGVAHTGVARFRDQIDYHVQRWLALDPSGHAPALAFFERMRRPQAFSVWIPLIARMQDLNFRDRGRILEMLHRLNPDVAGQLQALSKQPNSGVTNGMEGWLAGEADVRGAHLDQIKLPGFAITGEGSLWGNASVQDSDLRRCLFQNVDMAFCDLRGSDLAKAVVAGVNGPLYLEHAQLQGAHFVSVDFSGSSFLFADLAGARFQYCQLIRTDFSNARLTGAVFEDCDLSGARFDNGVRQAGVWGRLAGVTFKHCRFSGADLRELNFGPAAVQLQERAFRPINPGDPTNLLAHAIPAERERFGPVVTLKVPGARLIECTFKGGEWQKIDVNEDSLAAVAKLWHLDPAGPETRQAVAELRFVKRSMLALRLANMPDAILEEKIPVATLGGSNWEGSRMDATTRAQLESLGTPALSGSAVIGRTEAILNVWAELEQAFRKETRNTM